MGNYNNKSNEKIKYGTDYDDKLMFLSLYYIFRQYPNMKIRLSAPIEVENLLPYDFNFRIIDKTSGQDFSSFLRKGGTTPLHVIENGHLLLMNIHMPDTGKSSNDPLNILYNI